MKQNKRIPEKDEIEILKFLNESKFRLNKFFTSLLYFLELFEDMSDYEECLKDFESERKKYIKFINDKLEEVRSGAWNN